MWLAFPDEIYSDHVIHILLTVCLILSGAGRLAVTDDEEEAESHPFLLRLFIITPANNRDFFWKGGLMITYLLGKKSFLFFWKNLLNSKNNLVNLARLNPYPIFLWRPLIKRWSYFGLYVHSRARFLKFFKNRNVK